MPEADAVVRIARTLLAEERCPSWSRPLVDPELVAKRGMLLGGKRETLLRAIEEAAEEMSSLKK